MSGIYVEEVPRDKFNLVSREAHMAAFSEDRDPEFNRFDYALVCHNESKLTAYATVLEHDAESAYMQHGGSLSENAIYTVKSYLLMIEHLKKKYPVITTRILNTNTGMLKLALQAGFIIHGVEYYKETENFKGGILLCLHMENGGH